MFLTGALCKIGWKMVAIIMMNMIVMMMDNYCYSSKTYMADPVNDFDEQHDSGQ